MHEHRRAASRSGIHALAFVLAATAAGPDAAGARTTRSARAACPGAYTPAKSLTPAAGQHATLCLINQIRRRHGLRKLRPLAPLRIAATDYAAAMVRRGFFGHVAPDGQDLVARLRRTGFIRPKASWTVAENLGWGVGHAARPVEIVRTWMHSGPHRQNLLDRVFRRVGIGIDLGVPVASAAGAAKARGGATYVVDFGVRRGP